MRASRVNTSDRSTSFGPSLAMCVAALCAVVGVQQIWVGLSPTGRFAAAGVPDRVNSPRQTDAGDLGTVASDASAAGRLRTKSIQDIRVGERVMAHNPELTEQERRLLEGEPEPNAETWRYLKLAMTKPDGSRLDIELLRPTEWLEMTGAEVGATIELDLPELGAEGPAEVLLMRSCPEIKPGAGRVVTGTFAHEIARSVLDLYVEGLDEPIGVTSNHPFWSEDRQAFVPAGALSAGERLLGLDGRKVCVLALGHRPGAHRVYNLEVCTEHVYLVSDRGLLVHNNYLVTVSRWGRPGLKHGDWVMKGRASRWNYFRSGKWERHPWNEYAPFSSGTEYLVPAGSLHWPGGWLRYKGLFGQRIYIP